MKRVILTLLMVMAAGCALFLAPVDPDGATLETTQGIVRFSAGKTDALKVKLEIAAIGLRLNDAKCKLERGTALCDLGIVPAGRTYRITTSGAGLTTRAAYRRGSGSSYEIYSP